MTKCWAIIMIPSTSGWCCRRRITTARPVLPSEWRRMNAAMPSRIRLSYGPLRWRMAAVGVTTYANHAILGSAVDRFVHQPSLRR